MEMKVRPFNALRIMPLVLLLAEGGCTHVPLMTMAKLVTFDMATADPAILRVAARTPAVLMPRPDGTVLTLAVGPERAADRRVDRFVLEQVSDSREIDAVARLQRSGDRVFVYQLSRTDVQRVRHAQAQYRDLKQRGERGRLNIGVSSKACRQGQLPAGAILTSTYLKVSESDGYLPLLVDIDLRKELGEAAALEQVPECATR
jgi:hypothetical protein